MNKSEFLGLNLPSRDNTTDIADINAISDNFKTIDNVFLDLAEKQIPEFQTKENINLNFDDSSTNEEQYPSVPAVVNFTNRKVDPLKIVNSASGNAIALKDSAKNKLEGLKLYGKTTQNGTPTPDAPVPLVSVGDSGSYSVVLYGKNLFDINGNINTIGETKEQTNLNTVSGNILTCGANAGEMGGVGQKINVSVGNTITFSAKLSSLGSGASGGLLIYENGNIATYNFSGNLNKVIEVTYTTTTSELIFTFVTTGGVGAQFTDIQVEVGTQATPYEPCNKQSITLTDTLRGVGEVADEIDFTRGVKTQRIYRGKVSDFSTSLLNLPNGNKGLIVTMWNKIEKFKNALICSHAIEEKTTTTYKDGTCYENGVNIVICGNSTDTLDTLRAKYDEAIIQYELKKPIETPLTEQELNAYRHLMTNKPNTTILSEADMEVSYVADTKLYIDNKIAELTALTLEG